jgi:hypothetical protein
MSWSVRSGALVALLGAALVVSGCGGTDIDSAAVEALVKEDVENVRNTKVSSVDCPSGVAVEPQAKFSCTVHLDKGDTERATLLIRDEDANLSLVNLQPDK